MKALTRADWFNAGKEAHGRGELRLLKKDRRIAAAHRDAWYEGWDENRRLVERMKITPEQRAITLAGWRALKDQYPSAD